MAYVEYNYGNYRKEIRKLLRRRMAIKDKIRYHRNKADVFENEILPQLENELSRLLEKTKGRL